MTVVVALRLSSSPAGSLTTNRAVAPTAVRVPHEGIPVRVGICPNVVTLVDADPTLQVCSVDRPGCPRSHLRAGWTPGRGCWDGERPKLCGASVSQNGTLVAALAVPPGWRGSNQSLSLLGRRRTALRPEVEAYASSLADAWTALGGIRRRWASPIRSVVHEPRVEDHAAVRAPRNDPDWPRVRLGRAAARRRSSGVGTTLASSWRVGPRTRR